MKKTDSQDYESIGEMLEKLGIGKTTEVLTQELYLDMKEEAQKYEKDAGFHIKPNYAFWKKAPYWTIDEAIALSIECDPEHLNSKAINGFHENFLSFSQIIKIFTALKDLMIRSIMVNPHY